MRYIIRLEVEAKMTEKAKLDLKKLFEESRYNEIVELLKDSKDPADIYARILACTYLGDDKRAIEIYDQDRDVLEKASLVQAGKVILAILLRLGNVGRARKEVEHFKEAPYVDQATEEWIDSLDGYIDEYLFKKSDYAKALTVSEIRNKLASSSLDDIVYAISLSQNSDYRGIDFLKLYEESLKARLNYDLAYAIIFEQLVLVGYDSELIFNFRGKKMFLNPKNLTSKERKAERLIYKAINEIKSAEKNVSVAGLAIQYMSNIFFFLIPDYLVEKDLASLEAASLIASSDEFKVDFHDDELFKSLQYDQNKVDDYLDLLYEFVLERNNVA
jgi:hypothetical protein